MVLDAVFLPTFHRWTNNHKQLRDRRLREQAAPGCRSAIEAIQGVVRRNLSTGYAEGMPYGMPAWFVPHEVYPAGYHASPDQPLPFASVASQKKHIGIHLFCLHLDSQLMSWFERHDGRLSEAASTPFPP